MAFNTLLSALVFVSFIGLSLGAVSKCYQCGSVSGLTDDTCSDDNVESSHSATTCPLSSGLISVTYNYCSKLFTNGAVVRACATACVETDNLKCCDSDGCNGSTSVTVNLVGVVVALIAGLVFITAQ